jgi:hypothetical protein
MPIEATPENDIADNFSEHYDSDQNDEDSEGEDLPDDILIPILRAIEAKDYSIDSYRTVSTISKKFEEKSTG